MNTGITARPDSSGVPKVASAPVQDSASLMPIAVATLSASTVLTFDLYRQNDGHTSFKLYRDRNYPLLQADLDRLKDRGVETLYIHCGDAAQYRTYLEKYVLSNESIPAVQRFQV